MRGEGGSGRSGRHPLGILVQDQNQTAAKRLTGAARRYQREGTKYAAIDRLGDRLVGLRQLSSDLRYKN
jgi:hypothetical protein